MKRTPCSFLRLLFAWSVLLPTCLAATAEAAPKPGENDRVGWSADGNRHVPDDWDATAMALVEYDALIPQLAFAAQELSRAFEETGKEDLQVTLTVKADESSPEAFRIRRAGAKRIEVTGTDVTGAMYGGLEVADLLRLGLPIKDQQQKPFVKQRGVKINIPLDIRTPAFDDSGDAAQKNIETMWDFEFWKAYLDDLARYRYNVVSLWAAHPFPNMIKLKAYLDIAVDDVYYSKEALNTTHLDAALRLDDDTEGSLRLGKKITIEEKIKYWHQVFQYAADRGIEIMMMHWNMHMHGAAGKYGITNAQDNPATIKYLRACVREMLLTYPQITGIGTCAGENDDRYLCDEFMTEHFVFNTYGRAVMDLKQLQPEREIRFIIRRHSTEYDDFTQAFKDYTGGIIDTSVKYAVAHMYSSRRPQEWEKRIVDEGWLEKYKVWLNLRNDDIFMHRWGSPDYAREFIKWIHHEHVAGFYIGSDTYVWGREFISKNPETAGRLEIDKHWYRERLRGQFAYNNELGDDYWRAVLKHRFPSVDAKLLFEAWESVSEVIPQLNRSVWSPTDGFFAPEGCRRTSGFLTLDGYHFERPAMPLNRIENAPDPQCITVTDWARAHLQGQALQGVAPLQVAENLDGYAALAQKALPALRSQMGDNLELKETLNDIESMAYLGRYYADKMRGAAKLALYRESGRKYETFLDQAVAPNVSRLADSGVLFSRAYRDSTIVVLISDHGFHLAEKSHWQKGTLWEEATHSLMMWRVPGMTRAGSVSERFVSLQDIYPTLADLCRIEPPDYVDGRSLASLLKQPDAQWRSTAISALYDRYVSIRTERYRYIRYRDDQEEFYDCAKDPHEWTNQIGNRAYAAAIKTLRSAVPALSDMAPPMPSKKRKIR